MMEGDSREDEERRLQDAFEEWRGEIGREDELLAAAAADEGGGGSWTPGEDVDMATRGSPSEMETEGANGSQRYGEAGKGAADQMFVEDISSAQAKEQGNRLFARAEYRRALEWYNEAVQTATAAELAVALANRSLAKLKVWDAEGAAADARAVLSLPNIESKLRGKAEQRLKAAEKILNERDSGVLRDLGNSAFKASELDAAIWLYTRSIDVAKTSDKKALGLANRAQVYLKLKQFRSAEEDTRQALGLDLPGHVQTKTKYRRATALLQLGRAQEAREVLENILREDSAHASARKSLQGLLHSHPTAGDDLVRLHDVKPASQTPLIFPNVEVPDTPPKTFYEFESTWRNLRRSPAKRLLYLRKIPPGQYRDLIGDCLTSDLLEDISELLVEQGLTDSTMVQFSIAVLQALATVRRFDMVHMLLSPRTQHLFELILDRASESARTLPEAEANSLHVEIERLRKVYV